MFLFISSYIYGAPVEAFDWVVICNVGICPLIQRILRCISSWYLNFKWMPLCYVKGPIHCHCCTGCAVQLTVPNELMHIQFHTEFTSETSLKFYGNPSSKNSWLNTSNWPTKCAIGVISVSPNFTAYFSKPHFNIIIPPLSWSSKWLLATGWESKTVSSNNILASAFGLVPILK